MIEYWQVQCFFNHVNYIFDELKILYYESIQWNSAIIFSIQNKRSRLAEIVDTVNQNVEALFGEVIQTIAVIKKTWINYQYLVKFHTCPKSSNQAMLTVSWYRQAGSRYRCSCALWELLLTLPAWSFKDISPSWPALETQAMVDNKYFFNF